MSDSLEDFLKEKVDEKSLEVHGSMCCQQCNEVVNAGTLNEDEMVISYKCSSGHESKVRI